ncbi:hypothetical protein Sa4125_33400 [Aureimonas sp. SA4125]|uniref:BA14K family protein n=1 Tax=Aureimonas sp. SA4125 TaxID=2826993 RepID=UPI001CC4D5CF|nr:BA14K family protein [Aureimonas sp. SA4125]BDA85798.1 hypothetical protein Sa4125_33400 [Aureimonas sp. SA4125]
MRQRNFRCIAILLAASLFGLIGGYVNEAFARDSGMRSGDRGRGQAVEIVRKRHSSFSHDRGPSFRRDHHGRGFDRDRHYGRNRDRPSSGSYRSDERDYGRYGSADRNRGWRERQRRFDDHDRRRSHFDREHRHDRKRDWGGHRDEPRARRPLPRYNHQYGTEIAPADRSWISRDDDDRVVYYGGAAPYGLPPGSAAGIYPSGARWIDVGAERLDRRPVGTKGIDVAYAGGGKIIRLGRGFSARGNRSQREDLQPWSSGWLRHCTATYRSFDPSLGTYVGTDGRARFCAAR